MGAARDQQPLDDLKSQLRSARVDVYRSRILDVAETVFAEAGFEGAHIKDIARRAGLSVGTVYGIFDGKDAVFHAVHDARTQDLFARAAEIVGEGTSALDAILAGVDLTMRFFAEHPDYLRMHLRDRTAWSLPEQSTPLQSENWQRGIEVISATMALGMESGELHPGDPESCARIVMAMHQVKLAEWLARDPRGPIGPAIEELQALLRRAFAC